VKSKAQDRLTDWTRCNALRKDTKTMEIAVVGIIFSKMYIIIIF